MENFDLVKLIENVACELLENYRSRQATLVESRILEEGGARCDLRVLYT